MSEKYTAILDTLNKKPPPTTYTVTLTPDKAGEVVRNVVLRLKDMHNNTTNLKVKVKVIARYDRAKDRWKVTFKTTKSFF